MLFYMLQTVTGIVMATSYVAQDAASYHAIDATVRDSVYGWSMRMVHSTAASYVFATMYLHVARAVVYSVGPHVSSALLCSGVLIWLLMMAVAFLGYVLP